MFRSQGHLFSLFSSVFAGDQGKLSLPLVPLDFSDTFDTILLRCLLYKLDRSGIVGSLLSEMELLN